MSTDRFPRDGVTVSSDSYEWRSSGRWMLRGLRVAKPDMPGSYGPDLIDRWKGRVGGIPAFFDAPDPTFNVPSAVLNWEQVSGAGDAGSLVYIIEIKGVTTAFNAVVVPYYRDDACLDDGTGDDPVARPWPGEPGTDTRVMDGYSVAAGSMPYAQLSCGQKQGAWGAHGIHYFVTGDSDNLFTPETVTEIDALQWQFTVPTAAPTNVGDDHANNVRIPLMTLALPMTDAPAGAPPQASAAQATTSENVPVDIALSGADLDSCDLVFRIVDAPSSGQLGPISNHPCSPATPNTDTASIRYTPAAGFIGSASFTYVVGDGTTESTPATVTITITAPPPPCASGPQDGCLASTRAGEGRIALANSADDAEDALAWSWPNGQATAREDFGDPMAGTSFELCVFDADSRAVASALYRGGEDCAGRPCWRGSKSGFRYSRRTKADDGATSRAKLTLRAGEAGNAKITASAGGGLLDVGSLPPAAPVLVQLRASTGSCWEAAFSPPADVSDSGAFEDRAD